MRRLALLILLVACDHWPEEHAARCASWMQRAQTKSDSLNVDMSCATIAAAHDAQVTAATMGAANMAVSITR